ncbi:MAG: type III polyketide synthase [Rhodospirillaceae bacterium]|jgi:alkylresorcinol/alkylpyrone synthase|nr:type III polyketide synthase [Rhodospirillaceae bacterium]MBT5810344.1 type III polyketide synthase [Rhodospirillaceae bacterium]
MSPPPKSTSSVKYETSGPNPKLIALATATPKHKMRQADIETLGEAIFADRAAEFDRMRGIYTNAGIDTRYSCVGLDWYGRDHSWPERNNLYIENAVSLLRQSALACLAQAGLEPADVDGLVTVSTTGVATPSLDALLMNELPFRNDLQRLPIFGLGCAGGVLGLGRAATLAKAQPGSRWLVLVVELCGLTFRNQDKSKSNIVATALFGDGAAAALLSSAGDGPEIEDSGEHTWPDTLDVMGWRLKNDGFGVLFHRDIPDLVRRDMRGAASNFLERTGQSLSDIDHFVVHPGGAKVIDAMQDAFDTQPDALDDARSVLRDYGNMSAATVLFVLERTLKRGASGRFLMSALGPGFTAGFLTMTQNRSS